MRKARSDDALVVRDLRVQVEHTPILHGVSLTVRPGELHAIMGPNGSGKSTFANTLLGHPRYEVTSGSIRYHGTELVGLSPDKRARLGLFLAFQYPVEVPGVRLVNFLRMAYNVRRPKGEQLSAVDFYRYLQEKLTSLGMDESFVQRPLNEGFSGGEKKKCEVLQLAVLAPDIAVLDETDSGLDIDALKSIATNLRRLADDGIGMCVVTHYQRILRFLKPDAVHVLAHGRIVTSGDATLADQLERDGYRAYLSAPSGAQSGAHA
ncbi:MAG: Fe-S cluster assembly ATPase SufC [Candidatus Kerfeldbacteria bacterium]|nr:Fe-S cluster assembly ATPase SufC [Candidatus Kerfeldbacteria bacterium]